MPKRLKAYKNMKKAAAYRLRGKKRYYLKHQYSEGKRRLYTKLELKLIKQHSIPDVELARTIRRSLRAIHVVRAKMKGKYLSTIPNWK